MVYMFFDKKASDANIPDGVVTSDDLEQISEIIVEMLKDLLKPQKKKYMPSISKNINIDKSDEMANEYNNTYHSPVKMKPVNVKSTT